MTVGQTLQASDLTPVTVNDVIAACGPRLPACDNAQKTFRCATIVLSEQLLDNYAVAFYDWFTRRGEAKQRLSYASGFETGTCNPFYLATGERAVMFTGLKNEQPKLSISHSATGASTIGFIGKLGITYQPQVSTNLIHWVNEDPPVTTPLIQPPADAPISLTVTSSPTVLNQFYRVSCSY